MLRWALFALCLWASACANSCFGGEAPRGTLSLLGRAHFQAKVFPTRLDIAPKADVFLVAGELGPVQVWSVPRALSEPPRMTGALGISGAVTEARFMDDDTLFLAQEQGNVALWSWREAVQRFSHDFAARGRFALISADARFVAFGGAVFDRTASAEVGAARPLATQSALALSRRENRLVSAGFQEPWVIVRDLPSGKTQAWLAPDKVRTAALSADGSQIAIITKDDEVRLNQASGGALQTWSGPSQAQVVRFLPGDQRLVVVHARGVAVYDVASGRELYADSSESAILRFAFDANLVAAGTDQGTLLVWDCGQGKLLARQQVAQVALSAIALRAPKHLVLAADENNELSAWRLP